MIGWYFMSLRERQKVQQMVWRQMAITLKLAVGFLPCIKRQCFVLTAGPQWPHRLSLLVAVSRPYSSLQCTGCSCCGSTG